MIHVHSTGVNVITSSVAVLTLWLGIGLGTDASWAQSATQWHVAELPGIHLASPATTHWVRAYVRVPDAWASDEGLLADSVTLILEGVTDVCQVTINGQPIGTCGEITPNYRSARDETHRLKIPPGTLRQDQYNCVTLEISRTTIAGV